MVNGDISRIDGRATAQKRVTNNRNSIVPARRNTQAEPLQAFAEMRHARRGDVGGAEELLRVLSDASKAGRAVQAVLLERQRNQAAEEIAQGRDDALLGQQDPKLAAKSTAYRNGYSFESALSQVNELSRDVTTEVDELLADPEQEPDEDDVMDLLKGKFEALLLNPDGTRRSFGSPEADAAVRSRLRELHANVADHARKAITAQVHNKHLGRMASNLLDDVANGRPVDFEAVLARRLPGMDVLATKRHLTAALMEDIDERAQALLASGDETGARKALSVYDMLLSSKRKDGIPSLTPEEVRAVRNQRDQSLNRLEAEVEKSRRALQEATMDGLTDRYNAGRAPSRIEIIALRKEGKLDAEHVSQLFGWLDADAREARMEAREIARLQGDAAERSAGAVGDGIVAAFLTGQVDYGTAMKAVAARNADGSFGVGDVRRKATAETMSALRAVQSAKAAKLDTPDGKFGRDQIILTKRELLAKLEGVRGLSVIQKAELAATIENRAAAAMRTYATRVAETDASPRDVADQLTGWMRNPTGGGSRSKSTNSTGAGSSGVPLAR